MSTSMRGTVLPVNGSERHGAKLQQFQSHVDFNNRIMPMNVTDDTLAVVSGTERRTWCLLALI